MRRFASVLAFTLACGGRETPPPASTAPAPSAEPSASASASASASPSPGPSAAPVASTPADVGTIGLQGTGEGAGGSGDGIGLSSRGDGHGGLGSTHPAGPMVRQGALTVNGRLPPEVVGRIVRQNFGRFRLCYAEALRKKPTLAGKIVVRFDIATDGAVSQSTRDRSTDLPDADMVACVLKAFGPLSFPQPEGGVVHVTYPLIFAPKQP